MHLLHWNSFSALSLSTEKQWPPEHQPQHCSQGFGTHEDETLSISPNPSCHIICMSSSSTQDLLTACSTQQLLLRTAGKGQMSMLHVRPKSCTKTTAFRLLHVKYQGSGFHTYDRSSKTPQLTLGQIQSLLLPMGTLPLVFRRLQTGIWWSEQLLPWHRGLFTHHRLPITQEPFLWIFCIYCCGGIFYA